MVSIPSSSSVGAEQFVDVVEPRAAIDEQPPVAQRLDVERAARRCGTASVMISSTMSASVTMPSVPPCSSTTMAMRLRMAQKAAQQIDRLHRLRHKGRRREQLGVVRRAGSSRKARTSSTPRMSSGVSP